MRLIFTCTIALTIATPTFAHAAKKKPTVAQPCVAESVMPAINVYTLKTELMTAALSCGERERYNQFVGLRQYELNHAGQTMRTALKGKTNGFVTKVANVTGQKLDCAEAAGHFEQALSPEMQLLETIATTEWAQPRHGYRVCTKPTRKAK